ncbi:MAG: 1-aminocyclopropane-1-carboxylate deaminase, partial [Sulfurimonas sp.]|nr:1-aminocyclopropane-1-carboxylate deaminase [Sulfurimonas sp.]
MQNSPISKIDLEGRSFYVKRDDLIDKYLAGNKYRKLYTLLQTPSDSLNKIISYGGTQSNAMLAIAAMCKSKGWEFTYYSKPISKLQREENLGNYFHSLELG